MKMQESQKIKALKMNRSWCKINCLALFSNFSFKNKKKSFWLFQCDKNFLFKRNEKLTKFQFR